MEKLQQIGPGLFVASFGLLLYFVVIPYDTEIVDYGWLRPQTLPNIMAVILVIAGISLCLRPAAVQCPDIVEMSKVGLYLSLVCLAVLAISWIGFLPVAPLLALTVMWLVGERRPGWLLAGTVGTPVFIWLAVSILLERPLPG